MISLPSFIFLSLLASVASAVNDWSKPCFDGKCSYSLPSTAGAASGSLNIWGSANAISDITTAGGWQILGCSPDALAQDIRLVCTTDVCENLYTGGAEGKLVRLPENCGKSAFARVAKAWVPEDQSVPEDVAKRLVARGTGTLPGVKALRLDTNFGAIDSSKFGVVNIAIVGANAPGAGEVLTSATPNPKRSRLFKRQGVLDGVLDAVSDANDVDINESKDLQPIDIDKPFNLVDQKIGCQPNDLGVKVDVDAKAHALVNIGVVAKGTVVPPKFDNIQLVTTMTADINGTIDFIGSANGQLDSGKIKLFEIGIPGLDFAGILSVGPTFQINAQAIASLDAAVDLKVGINYHVENAKLLFPPDGKQAEGGFDIQDTPLKLSATPSVQANGTVEAHLIPSLNLGLDGLAGVAGANVFIELDGKAVLKLNLEAEAGDILKQNRRRSLGAKDLQTRNYYREQQSRESSSKSSTASRQYDSEPRIVTKTKTITVHHQTRTRTRMSHHTTSTKNGHNTSSTRMAHDSASTAGNTSESQSSSTSPTSTSSSAAPSATGQVGAIDTSGINFGGCVEVDAGFAVNVGADASFFNLFDQNTKATLFSKDFQLFKKCFGSKAGTENRRRSFSTLFNRSAHVSSLQKRLDVNALVCAAAGLKSPEGLVDQIIKAAGIKGL